MNYRKYYRSMIGMNIAVDFEIHHIDCDRDNNHISNLVSIPRELHKKYHNYKNKVENLLSEINTTRSDIYDIETKLDSIRQFSQLRNKIYEYELMRDSLLYKNGFTDVYNGTGLNNLKSWLVESNLNISK